MKKNVAFINLGNFGSTGKIMRGIGSSAAKKDYKTYCFFPGSKNNYPKGKQDILMCSEFTKKINYKLASFTGFNGFFSVITSYRLLCKLNRIKPDIIHLHNIHGSYINLPLLFRYIKKHSIPIIWTLHDCWSFTGHCPHFTMVNCEKWKTGCYKCPQYRYYPKSYVDRTKTMYKLKKKWFTGVENMTLVTPSQWLADLVKQSYLKDYNVKVINNGIDLNIFKPTPSNFREKYNLGDKYIVLGIAFGWGKRKGLDVFIELSKCLDSNKYKIVLVGTDKNTEEQLPDNIISIHRTQNQQELAEIYTAADIFANPTREDNYPTVNMEAIACGTPVITFRTGGSPEILDDTCGVVVDCDDNQAMLLQIQRICEIKPFSKKACIKQATKFDMNDKYQEYMKLYEDSTYSTKRTLQ